MAKQGGGGARGQKRAAKIQARQQRIAQDELRREEHARLVVGRSGDPRFVQRTNHPDGSATVRWDVDTPAGRGMREGLDAQLAAFRRKFGREPGPQDPLFFDPDADEPIPITEQGMASMFDEMIESAERAGIDPVFGKAWRDLGYLVTTENQHTFSAAEVEAWHDAVASYDEDGDVAGDDDGGVKDVLELIDGVLRQAVDRTLVERSVEPGREVTGLVMASDLVVAEETDDADGATGLSMAFAVLAGWLTGAREGQADPEMADVVAAWVRAELGDQAATTAARMSGLLGSTSDGDSTVQQLIDELQGNVLPALIWLAAGTVAQYGGGDVAWLPRLDESEDDETFPSA